MGTETAIKSQLDELQAQLVEAKKALKAFEKVQDSYANFDHWHDFQRTLSLIRFTLSEVQRMKPNSPIG